MTYFVLAYGISWGGVVVLVAGVAGRTGYRDLLTNPIALLLVLGALRRETNP